MNCPASPFRFLILSLEIPGDAVPAAEPGGLIAEIFDNAIFFVQRWEILMENLLTPIRKTE